jgi:NTE family protein
MAEASALPYGSLVERGPMPRPRAVAILLTGAATKGAFEAGVLHVLAERQVPVTRIVAASSGALNGVAYAAGVRACRQREAAQELVALWERRGGFCDAVHPSLRAILARRGFSDGAKLLRLMRDNVRPSGGVSTAPIELHIVVAPLDGIEGSTLGEPATTYAHVVSFGGEWFDEGVALERVLTTAAASAAFPVLYTPVDLPGLGPCVDGGIVANTPIRYVYGDDDGHSIDAIVVVSPTPAFAVAPRRPLRGVRLVAHMLDMLFSEWLFQDLRQSRIENERLRSLETLAKRKSWSEAQLDEVRETLGWDRRHVLPIIAIRPTTPLPGSLFGGFKSRATRQEYIAVGKARASEILDGLAWR